MLAYLYFNGSVGAGMPRQGQGIRGRCGLLLCSHPKATPLVTVYYRQHQLWRRQKQESCGLFPGTHCSTLEVLADSKERLCWHVFSRLSVRVTLLTTDFTPKQFRRSGCGPSCLSMLVGSRRSFAHQNGSTKPLDKLNDSSIMSAKPNTSNPASKPSIPNAPKQSSGDMPQNQNHLNEEWDEARYTAALNTVSDMEEKVRIP